MPFIAIYVPSGWLYANGQAISRTTYANLFSLLGTAYGAGNGTTTFNVPDFRGAFLRGWDDARGLDPSRGMNSYQADSIVSHTHTVAAGQASGISSGCGLTGGGFQKANDNNCTAVTTSATGGTETRPKNYALYYCIKY